MKKLKWDCLRNDHKVINIKTKVSKDELEILELVRKCDLNPSVLEFALLRGVKESIAQLYNANFKRDSEKLTRLLEHLEGGKVTSTSAN